jgi:amino acid adenylation domain-containing protein
MSDITKRIGSLSPEKRELLERLLKKERVDVARTLIMPRKGDAGVAPLSFAQQRLWFLNRLRPESAFYNMPSALRLTGALDIGALERTLGEIVRRHESLRTTFDTVGGEPRQVIAPATSLQLSTVDLSALPPHEQSSETERLVEEEARRPFDLARDPLLRARLLTLKDDEHVLLFTMHHIVSDGWSIGVLLNELSALYAAFRKGHESPLAELPIQYADYAVWQREYLSGEVLAEQLAYWRNHLGGELPVLELPSDRPRPPAPSYRGAEELLGVEPVVVERLRALGRESGTTLFMTLLAAFDVLLYRYTGQEDIVVGTPVAGRSRAEVEGLIGFFINTLALRTKLNGRTSFKELLGRVREVCLGAFAHQELPFEKVVDELQPERSTSLMPLFQVVFALQNAADFELELPGLDVEPLDTETETSKFDLRLSAHETPEHLTLSLRYSTDMFDAPRMRRMLEHYCNLLAAIAADPAERISRLPLLTDAERHQLLSRRAAGRRDFPQSLCLHQLFEAQVERTPAAVALVSGGERLTYRELNARANRLARRLRDGGVGAESLVGICLPRGAGLVVGLLGVLKAGGAYLPLDPDYPRERLAFMVDDARVEALITTVEHAEKFGDRPVRIVCLDSDAESIARESDENVEAEVSPQSLAYVIYTSGSTGQPKGVSVTHANVARLFDATESWFGFCADDVWTLFHSYAFDFSVWELWGALLYGGRLVVVPYFVSRSPVEFLELLRAERVTILNQTPSAFRQLMRAEEASADAAPLSLRLVIFGGEALELQSLRPWFERHDEARPRLVNMYGITETTVHVTYRPVSAADANGDAGSLIGVPIPDLELYVLDGEMQPSPVGIPGELYVGGAGLARGYLNRPALTAERFVPHPFAHEPGARLYKTGDVARLLDSGDIEYLGRSDSQVKIRGFRIELGEIEAALARHPAVAEGVVVARDDGTGERRLVAYIIGARGATAPRTDELQSFLRERLPEHMIPASFVVLDSLLLTPSGKLDRGALPAPGQARPDTSRGYVPPQTKLESLLADMWREILGLDRVGVEDNFFELGGDSIKGAIFINRLQDRLAEIVHVITIFNDPTIKQLAAYLNEQYAAAVRKMTGEDAPDAAFASHAGLTSEPSAVSAAAPAARRATLRAAQLRELIPSRTRRDGRAAGGKNPPAVFVLSPPRSGSTLFRVMLAGHPLLFAPPELELLSFDTLGERRAAFSGKDSFWLEGLVRAVMELKGCDAAEAKRLTEEMEAGDLTTKECYGMLQGWLGERKLVDKSPSYALEPSALEKAEADFDGALYIHLIRHPFGMIRSFEEARLEQIFFRHEHPFTRRELAELIWLVSQQNILRFLEGVPPERQHRIRFEELLDEPEAVLRGVCRFLNVDFVADMRQPYRDKEKRMTDGIYAESRMLGDVKFHRHAGVDARVGERWREQRGRDDLTPETWEMAVKLGYQAEPEDDAAAPSPEAESTSARSAGAAGSSASSMLITLQPHGDRPPFFCVHPAGSNKLCYVDLARQLGEGQPFYGLQSPESDERGETPVEVEGLAALYVEALRNVQPHGPYLLGGWSLGGIVAFEMAQQLLGQGQQVALLALLDSVAAGAGEELKLNDESLFRMFANNLGRRFGVEFADLSGRTLDEQLSQLRRRAVELNALPASMDMRQMHGLFRSFKDIIEAVMRYEPRNYPGRVNLFRAEQRLARTPTDPTDGWGALAAGGVEMHVMPGDHFTMISMPHARPLADRLSVCIEAALAAAGATEKSVFG